VAPHLALIYVDTISADSFSEFARDVAAEGLNLHVESREISGPYAALEWLIPTAVIVYVSKSYFDGFLKEMGKDHYALFKRGLNGLYEKVLGAAAPEVTLVSSAGKVKSDQPYSLYYSIIAEAGEGLKFKLLLAQSASAEEYQASVAAFLAFVETYHANTMEHANRELLDKSSVVGGTILLGYNLDTRRLESLDPLRAKKPSR
jgi:hypothetical protein